MKRSGTWVKCSDNHPEIAINCTGETYYIRGGSCTSPGGNNTPDKCDIFVGLDMGMVNLGWAYPWHKKTEFLFRIQDGSVPKLKEFRKLLEYLDREIRAGKKVFIGCIGGHGRTGLVLAALITYMTGDKDSVAYLREVYCEKVVETKAQVDWLHRHFKIHKVVPYYEQRDKSWKFRHPYLDEACLYLNFDGESW